MSGKREKNLSQRSEETTRYYNEHAAEFYEQTVNADMAALYAPFLSLLPAEGHILDAGCGSGRDTLHFLRNGFRVTAFDASKELAVMASRLTGQRVDTLRFDEVNFRKEFDGIWACASLLHVSRVEMDAVLERLSKALKPEGVMFVSFKLRDGEWEQSGRFFNGYDMHSFGALVLNHPMLRRESIWVTEDVRPERRGEQWLNALLRRQS